jgi:DNA-binding FrmR family transcriptional regulator
MKGVIINERNVIAMLKVLAAGRQSEPTDSNEMVDQLIEQLEAARASLRQTREELLEAHAEHAQMMADPQAHFDEEVAEMRKILTDARAELAKFQACNSFVTLERTSSDTMN